MSVNIYLNIALILEDQLLCSRGIRRVYVLVTPCIMSHYIVTYHYVMSHNTVSYYSISCPCMSWCMLYGRGTRLVHFLVTLYDVMLLSEYVVSVTLFT